MTTRLVHAPEEMGTWVANRIAEGTKERSVLVLSTRVNAERLLTRAESAGADLKHLVIMDTRADFAPPGREGNVIAGMSLDAIEIVAAKASKIARAEAEGPILLIVDCVDPIAHLMSAEALGEMAQRVVNTLKAPTSLHDWVYGHLDDDYLAALRLSVDEEISV